MPPKCTRCGKEAIDYPNLEFDLIYFKPTEQDKIWEKRVEDEGLVGHPPNAYWFCAKHIEKAKKYESLHAQEAMQSIKPKI